MPNLDAMYWQEQNRKSQKIGLISTLIMSGVALFGIGIQSYRLEQFKENMNCKSETNLSNYQSNQSYVCKATASQRDTAAILYSPIELVKP